jgi:hypothetical protein
MKIEWKPVVMDQNGKYVQTQVEVDPENLDQHIDDYFERLDSSGADVQLSTASELWRMHDHVKDLVRELTATTSVIRAKEVSETLKTNVSIMRGVEARAKKFKPG